jgi:DNA-binding transcriptional MerR regulator
MHRTISDLASCAGVSTDTLRYYERIGLLEPSGRTPAGYRLYGDDVAERLCFIAGAKRMGLRLDDIRQLLEISDKGQCPCGHTDLLVERRLQEVEAEIRQLRAVRQQLLALKAANDACTDPSGAVWASCVTVSQTSQDSREGGDDERLC